MKISIIGIGRVGATAAYTLMVKGLGTQLLLYDVRQEVSQAEAADLSHANAFTGHLMSIVSGGMEGTAGSDWFIISGGDKITDLSGKCRNSLQTNTWYGDDYVTII
jgi:L-lactate dehydrogenase